MEQAKNGGKEEELLDGINGERGAGSALMFIGFSYWEGRGPSSLSGLRGLVCILDESFDSF